MDLSQRLDIATSCNQSRIDPTSSVTFFATLPRLFYLISFWFILAQNIKFEQKGVVIICHGLGEHIQRYEYFAKELNVAGFAVYGIDHQGHGMSDGDRCYVKDFNDYVDDVLLFSERIRLEYNNQNCKLFLFGHSMGGLIAALAAQRADKRYKEKERKKQKQNSTTSTKTSASTSVNRNLNSNDNASSNNNNNNNIDSNNSEMKSDKSDDSSRSRSSSIDGPLYDGVILSSPCLGVAPEQDLPQSAKNIAWHLAKLVPKLPILGLNNNALSHEPTV